MKLKSGDRITVKIVFLFCISLPMPIPLSFGVSAQAQDTGTSEANEKAADKAEFQRWIKYYTRSAEAYKFRLADEKDAKLIVSPTPLMTFAHPWAGGTTHGAFFVWTRLGRAELISAIWSSGKKGQSRPVYHEFHSLSTGRLEPVRIGSHTWRPKGGIELKPIPGAAPPKKSPGLRLAQMRSLAREFKGFSTPHGKELRLRTLPQPLNRYQSKRPDVLDGAVFGMFADWDPDIILLIEARKTVDDFEWVYGYGRFNGCPLRLEHKGIQVWKEGLVPLSNPQSNFFAVGVGNLNDPSVSGK